MCVMGINYFVTFGVFSIDNQKNRYTLWIRKLHLSARAVL